MEPLNSNFLLESINSALAKNIDETYKKGQIIYHEPSYQCLGVKVPVVRKIANEYYEKVKNLEIYELFKYCEIFLEQNYGEYQIIAFQWAYKARKYYLFEHFAIFESWLEKYINNWSSCDDLCTHPFGESLYIYPQFLPNIKNWTSSENQLVRRAAAVILIYSIRKKKYLSDVFDVAEKLLLDKEVMVQKGYGWMLKETGNNYPDEVYAFVLKYKDKMPRIALRYAIENFSKERKVKAMEKR